MRALCSFCPSCKRLKKIKSSCFAERINHPAGLSTQQKLCGRECAAAAVQLFSLPAAFVQSSAPSDLSFPKCQKILKSLTQTFSQLRRFLPSF